MICAVATGAPGPGSLILWAAIGVVGGIVAAALWGGKRVLVLDIVIGLVASLCGGYASKVAIGESSQYQFELATLSAVFFTAAALLLFAWLVRRVRK